MTPEQIEQRAKELYPNPDESLRKLYSYRAAFKQQEDLRFAILQGYNLCKPEIDALQERVKELEEGLNSILIFCEDDGKPVDGFKFRENILSAKQLLTNKPNNNG